MFRRLRLERQTLEQDTEFVLGTFKFLEGSQTPWPQFWFDWCGGGDVETVRAQSPIASFYTGEGFQDWYKLLKGFTVQGERLDGARPPSLLYDEIGDVWTPIDQQDDWSVFHEKVKSFT